MCARILVCFQRNLVTLAKARPAQMIFITTSTYWYDKTNIRATEWLRVQGDFDADEPMMLGSDDEFDNVYLEDLVDEDDKDDNVSLFSNSKYDNKGSILQHLSLICTLLRMPRTS